MTKIDWDSLYGQVGATAPQAAGDDFDKTEADFMAFVSSGQKKTEPTSPVESGITPDVNELDQLRRNTVQFAYGRMATAAEAFGQFDLAKDFRDTMQYNMPTGDAPVLGELPSTRFAYNSATQGVMDIGTTVGLALIPVVGIPLAAADIIIQQYGESRANIREETGEDQPFSAFVPAAINSALDAAVPARLLKKFGLDKVFKDSVSGQVASDAKAGYLKQLKDFGLDLSITGFTEGATEVAQNAVNLATVRVLKDTDLLSNLTPDEQNELWADFWGGFAGGAAAHSVVSGFSMMSEKTAMQDLEKTISDDNEILSMIQGESEPEGPAPMSREEATKWVISQSLQQPPAIIAEGNTNDQAGKKEDLPRPPASVISNQQKVEIAKAIRSMEGEEKQIAIASLQNKITELEALKTAYYNRTAADEANPLVEIEGNRALSRNFATVEQIYELPETAKQAVLIDGSVVNSSIPRTPAGDIDLTDGVLIVNDMLDKELSVEQVQRAEQLGSLMDELGLMTNPLNKEPMRLIIKYRPENNGVVASAGIIDRNTYDIFLPESTDAADEGMSMIHELGHLLVAHTMASLDQKQLTKLQNLWINDLSASPLREDYYGRFSPTYANDSRAKVAPRGLDKTNLGNAYYKTSLQEYLADRFSMAAYNKIERDALKKDGLSQVYSKLHKAFGKAFNIMKKAELSDVAGLRDMRFNDFMRYASVSRELRERQAQLEQLQKDEKAAKANESMLGKPDKENGSNIYITQGNVYTIPNNSDLGKTINFVNRLGLRREADNLAEVSELNLGFLGNNLRGAAARKLLTPLQIAEQAELRGFSLPTKYMELVQSFQVTKMRIIEKADTTLREWTGLGKDQSNRVSRLLYLISTKSDELNRRLTEDEINLIATQVRATTAEVDQWRKIDRFMIDIVDQLEQAMVYEAAKIYIQDSERAREFRDRYFTASKAQREALIEEYTGRPLFDLQESDGQLTNQLWDALNASEQQVAKMRNRNYFPRSRLGEYAVRVTARTEGVQWEDYTSKHENETVGFYAFDTEKEQKAFLDTIRSQMGNGLKATAYKMSSEVFAVMGMPIDVINQIRRDVKNLTQDQIEQLNDISLQRAPGRTFLKHLTRRRGIQGYSEDALRVFANYSTSAANHTAKAEWASDMSEVINEMERTATAGDMDVNELNDLRPTVDYFKRHMSYMFKPDNDWARLRALGFLYYLGFNVKSAAVNFMQTPMVLYPSLAKHTSDANAVRRISGAMKDAVRAMRGVRPLPREEQDMLQKMIESGLIDESMVSELAGMAEADALKRLVPGMDLKSKFDKFSHAAGVMFRIGEKYNRYVAAIASYRVAKDNGLNHDDAITFTRDSIQSSQFEYSRWNRAEFMRGKKSVLFLFWQYMQHASYLAFGGKGSKTAIRMWVLALAVAGLEGLPFAELILDLLDLTGTQVKKVLGDPNPRVSLREDLREIITEFTDKPDVLLKGMSYFYGLGPLHAASLLGIPVPQTSTRGSLSYGNPIPWFDGLTDPTITEGEQMLAKTVAAIAGPVGGIALGMVDAMMSSDQNNWKRWEKVLPLFARNASTGTRWLTADEETDSSNAPILTFTTPEERAEGIIKSLGFQPTRVDQTRQQIRASQVQIIYHQTRREALLKQLDYAYLTDNREAVSDVLKEIGDYNKAIMKEPGLAPFVIKSNSISRSVRERAKRRAEKAMGIRQGKEGIMLEAEMQKLYPVNSGDN